MIKLSDFTDAELSWYIRNLEQDIEDERQTIDNASDCPAVASVSRTIIDGLQRTIHRYEKELSIRADRRILA